MSAFFLMPLHGVYGVLALAVLCAMAQSVLTIFSLYRYRNDVGVTRENVMECFLLVQVLVINLSMGDVLMSLRERWAFLWDPLILRWLLVIGVVFLGCWIVISVRRIRNLTAIVSVGLLLPFWADIMGRQYVYAVTLSLLLLLVRGVILSVRRYRQIRSGISFLSVKEALELSQTGILFAERSGRILLVNHKMQDLMAALTGRSYRDARAFVRDLSEGVLQENVDQTQLDNQRVYTFQDGFSCQIKEQEIRVKRRKYQQITAVDVTRQWDAVQRLREQNAVLQERSDELKRTIENIRQICWDEETLQVKIRIHDVLGQKIAMLIRSLREKTEPDMELLRIFRHGLPDELKKPAEDISVHMKLGAMIDLFRGIGVKISFDGELPTDEERGPLYLEIITEGVTNAVRHGFSTQIHVSCQKKPLAGVCESIVDGERKRTSENAMGIRSGSAEWVLSIRNNGIMSGSSIVEGGGIGNIRKKVAALSGSVQITTKPCFRLTVRVPVGGEHHVESSDC